MALPITVGVCDLEGHHRSIFLHAAWRSERSTHVTFAGDIVLVDEMSCSTSPVSLMPLYRRTMVVGHALHMEDVLTVLGVSAVTGGGRNSTNASPTHRRRSTPIGPCLLPDAFRSAPGEHRGFAMSPRRGHLAVMVGAGAPARGAGTHHPRGIAGPWMGGIASAWMRDGSFGTPGP